MLVCFECASYFTEKYNNLLKAILTKSLPMMQWGYRWAWHSLLSILSTLGYKVLMFLCESAICLMCRSWFQDKNGGIERKENKAPSLVSSCSMLHVYQPTMTINTCSKLLLNVTMWYILHNMVYVCVPAYTDCPRGSTFFGLSSPFVAGTILAVHDDV